jgi:predicted small lipoprotein YifL
MPGGRVAAALAALALAACGQPGSLVLTPADVGVRVTERAADRLTLDADGAAVIVATPPGLCVGPDDLHLDAAAAVAMLRRCGGQETMLTRIVSVSAAPLAPPGGAGAALDVMASHLGRTDGWRDMGFGVGGEALRVAALERDADALLVVMEPVEGQGAIGARCRALTEINGRLAVVTVAAPPGRPAAATVLLDQTRQILAALRAANVQARPLSASRIPLPTRRSAA